MFVLLCSCVCLPCFCVCLNVFVCLLVCMFIQLFLCLYCWLFFVYVSFNPFFLNILKLFLLFLTATGSSSGVGWLNKCQSASVVAYVFVVCFNPPGVTL